MSIKFFAPTAATLLFPPQTKESFFLERRIFDISSPLSFPYRRGVHSPSSSTSLSWGGIRRRSFSPPPPLLFSLLPTHRVFPLLSPEDGKVGENVSRAAGHSPMAHFAIWTLCQESFKRVEFHIKKGKGGRKKLGLSLFKILE